MDERTQAVPWNHRYLCYCRWHGLPPADMLAFDGARYPGGQMSGFMRWVNGRWNRWCRAGSGVTTCPETTTGD